MTHVFGNKNAREKFMYYFMVSIEKLVRGTFFDTHTPKMLFEWKWVAVEQKTKNIYLSQVVREITEVGVGVCKVW